MNSFSTSGRQGDQNQAKNNPLPIRIQTLARPTGLGFFYDANKDDFIDMPISQKDLEPYISTRNCGGNEYEFISDDELTSKFKNLNVDGELQCSVLANIVNLQGSAKYLTDEKKSNRTIRVTCLYKFRSKHQSLDSSFSKVLSPEHIHNVCGPATHIVTSIIWGANIIAKLEVEESEDTKNKDVSGMLKTLMDIPGVSIGGNAGIKDSDDIKLIKKYVKITIFSDVKPNMEDSLIRNYEEFQAFLRKVPDFIRDKYDDKGIPIECQTYPLALLTDKAQIHVDNMTREVESLVLDSVCKIIDSFRDQLRELNDLRDDCLPFRMVLEADLEELENSRMELKKGLCKFQDKFQKNLLEYRKPELHSQGSNCLDKFLQNFNESDLHPRKLKSQLKSKLDSLKAKLNFLHRFSDLEKKIRTMEYHPDHELKRTFRILSKANLYDLFSGNNKTNTFVLYIDLEALERYNFEENKQINFFFDLAFDKKYKEANLYVLDYNTHNKGLFESPGSPEGPLIHYYQGKNLMTQDLFNENFDFLTSKLVLCETSEDLDRLKSTQTNSICFVLYTPLNAKYKNSANEVNLDKFKQLMSHESYMFGILRQRKLNNHKDTDNITAVQILVYYQEKLISNDYLRDSKYVDHLLELFKLGARIVQPQNLKVMLKDEQRYVMLYSKRLIETDTKKFYSLYQQLKKKLETTNLPVWLLDHGELLTNREDYSVFLNVEAFEKSVCDIFYYKDQHLQSYEVMQLSLQKNRSMRHLEEVTIMNIGELTQYKNTKISLLKFDLGNKSNENPCCIRRKLLKIKYERVSFTLSIWNKTTNSLIWNKMTNSDFEKIRKIVVMFQNIQDLNIDFNDCARDNELLQLCEALPRLGTLCSLEIICCGGKEITDIGINQLSQSLIHLQDLAALRIRIKDSQNITDDGITALCSSVDQLHCLTELFLGFPSYNQVTDRSIIRISESVSRNSSISSLTLCFPGCEKITDNAVISLSKSLLLLKNLIELRLWFSGCKLITDIGLSELSKSLAQLDQLTEVSLEFAGCPEITATAKEKLKASMLHVKTKHLFTGLISFK